MNCLITGGGGFIGAAIATKLINNKFTVTIIDDLSTGSKNKSYVDGYCILYRI